MDKKIDLSKAPEGTEYYRPCGGNPDWYRFIGGQFCYFDKDGDWVPAISSVHECFKIPVPAIKSLEERIKDRAIAELAADLEEAMRHLRNVAKEATGQPSGVGDMTIAEVIDAAGAAIMKARSPGVADRALEKALDRLAEQAGPTPMFVTAGPSRK